MKFKYSSIVSLVMCSALMSTGSLAAKVYSNNSNLNRYIVVLKDEGKVTTDKLKYAGMSKSVRAKTMASEHGLDVKYVYNKVINGFVVVGSKAAITNLSKSSHVEYIEQDGIVTKQATQNNPVWNLDRIDQRGKSLNSKYSYDRTGVGVTAYVVDTGIRASHNDLRGRVANGWDAINRRNHNGTDCEGHGTHVAGTIGGTTYGVAKQVNLVPVRVLDCNGDGKWSDFAAGLDWIVNNGVRPAVINASLGGGGSRTADDAIRRAFQAGFTVVVAAGNENTDACSRSPARVKEALTIGATDSNDKRASFSNYGQCVDVWAPGVNVKSTYRFSDSSTRTLNGTSMASPHVAGVAALYLQGAKNASPSSVINHVMGKVTFGRVTDRKTGDTPNLLAYSRGTSSTYTAIHRYYNHGIGDHFYTANWSELQSAPDSGWKYEGVLGYSYRKNVSGTKPLYRYYHSGSTDHFYTTNWGELGSGHSGWKYEGIATYLPTSGNTKDVFRYYNSKIGDHFYTGNWGELEGGKGSWKYEGVAGKIFKGPQD